MKPSPEEAIKNYYEEWWENPADPRSVIFDRLNQYVQRRLPLGSGKRALDLGSGTGTIVSYLVDRGYAVTAVEFNEDFAARLRRRFPGVRVLTSDVRTLVPSEQFDLTTCIELTQNLDPKAFRELVVRLRGMTTKLHINVSNSMSLHGMWVRLRRFQAPFVWQYAASELHAMLEDAGFRVTHTRGIGLVTPITLHRDFRGTVVPRRLARLLAPADRLAPALCHLYYVEAH